MGTLSVAASPMARPSPAQPQPRQASELVPGPDAQVAVKRHRGVAPKRQRPFPPSLAEQQGHVQIQVDHAQAGQLGPAGALQVAFDGVVGAVERAQVPLEGAEQGLRPARPMDAR
jgi:hypothetical protein